MKEWQRRYAVEVDYYWQKDDKILTIIKKRDWVVEVNAEQIGSAKTYEDAKEIAYKYMSEN